MIELQSQFNLTYIFISHDLSVVKRFCDRTAVLYLGKIVEIAESERLYREPLHPYSQALIRAIPEVNPEGLRAQALGGLEGDVPSPINPPKGCHFHTRCPHKMPICSEQEPPLKDLGGGHKVACFLH